jgi:hypothetical protein
MIFESLSAAVDDPSPNVFLPALGDGCRADGRLKNCIALHARKKAQNWRKAT